MKFTQFTTVGTIIYKAVVKASKITSFYEHNDTLKNRGIGAPKIEHNHLDNSLMYHLIQQKPPTNDVQKLARLIYERINEPELDSTKIVQLYRDMKKVILEDAEINILYTAVTDQLMLRQNYSQLSAGYSIAQKIHEINSHTEKLSF